MDELSQILDRIDVVVWRRRDQAHARHRETQPKAMYSETLPTGQLATFAGLGALRDLDLDLVGRNQVRGGNAEAARSRPA